MNKTRTPPKLNPAVTIIDFDKKDLIKALVLYCESRGVKIPDGEVTAWVVDRNDLPLAVLRITEEEGETNDDNRKSNGRTV